MSQRPLSLSEMAQVLADNAIISEGMTPALKRFLKLHHASLETRVSLMKKACLIMEGCEVSSKDATGCMEAMVLDADSLASENLVTLAEFLLDTIKTGGVVSGRSMDLFPKLFCLLQALTQIPDSHQSGRDYADHILHKLCSRNWPASSVARMTCMLREIPLSLEQLSFAALKAIRCLSDVGVDEWPPVVYQILLLTNKGHKALILSSLLEQLGVLEQQSVDAEAASADTDVVSSQPSTSPLGVLRPIQGTVMLHIVFSVKQDQELGKEVMRVIKTNPNLPPFSMALALSCSRVPRFHDEIFDCLKKIILTYYRDLDRASVSGWMATSFPVQTDIPAIIMGTARNSVYGWDYAVHGLVYLGLSLMDSFVIDLIAPRRASPSHQCASLGIDVLFECFRSHEVVRKEIVDQIFNRIISKSASSTPQYISLLSRIVHGGLHMVTEYIPRIREAVDYLSLLNVDVARGILEAIGPLLEHSTALRDAVMLVLRKAMFSREPESKKVAVEGLMVLLFAVKVHSGSSQRATDFSKASEALYIEILGSMRRCFTQQAAIRGLIYRRLAQVSQRNSMLHTMVLEVLEAQLTIVSNDDSAVTPLRFEAITSTGAADKVLFLEPLDVLIQSYGVALTPTPVNGVHDGSLERLTTRLLKLAERLCNCKLSDFELDQSADFSALTSVGQKNSIHQSVFLGLHEALIEVVFLSQFNVQSCQLVMDLFRGFQTLHDLGKDGGDKKKGRSIPQRMHTSVLLFGSLAKMAFALSVDQVPDHADALSVLRGKPAFSKYIFRTLHAASAQLLEMDAWNAQARTDLIFEDIAHATIAAFTEYIAEPHKSPLCKVYEEKEKEKEKGKLKILCIEVVLNLLTVISRFGHAEFRELLVKLWHLAKNSTAPPCNATMLVPGRDAVKWFQRHLVSILLSDRVREAIPLFEIITLAVSQFPSGDPVAADCAHWIQEVCHSQRGVEDLVVLKALLQTALMLAGRTETNLDLLRVLCVDVALELGEEDEKPEGEVKWCGVASLQCCQSVAPAIIITTIDKELDHVSRAIARLLVLIKAHTDVGSEPEFSEAGRALIYKRLRGVTELFLFLAHDFLENRDEEALLKLLKAHYATLAEAASQLFLCVKMWKVPVEGDFEILVKIACSQLAPVINLLVTQNKEAGSIQEKNSEKARAMRESKLIPDLACAMEQFDRHVVKLASKTHTSLAQYVRRGTSHDFRIANVDKVLAERLAELDEKAMPKKRKKSTSADPSGAKRKKEADEDSSEIKEEDAEDDDLVHSSDLENDEPLASGD